MSVSSSGLHHVTAIAGRAQANIEFYVRLLGLRLVKRTVNYEDPRTYHFYFGDALGNPGSLITFFPWPGAGEAVRGQSEALAVSFRVPPGALPFWRDRLDLHGLENTTVQRGNREIVTFSDPDGTSLELVEGQEPPAPPAPVAPVAPVARAAVGTTADTAIGTTAAAGTTESTAQQGNALDTLLAPTRYWTGSSVPAEAAIIALDTLTLNTSSPTATADILASVIGWRPDPQAGSDSERIRLIPATVEPAMATAIELVKQGPEGAGRLGTGSIHHVAFRVPDDETLEAARKTLIALGLSPTRTKNRTYFRSVYFRDPAGAVLELATDTPGFLVDEPADELGLAFKLPDSLEPDRQDLRSQLPVTASPEYADRFR